MSEQANSEKQVVMLTTDRQVDRRILLEADSLEAAGWAVTIIAMPMDAGHDDADQRTVRLSAHGGPAIRENLLLKAYRLIRGAVPMNGFVMRTLKRLAWRYLVDQEAFFVHLFASTVERYSPDVFVAHDLPMLAVARRQSDRCGAKLVYDSHELYCEQEFSERERSRWAQIEAKHIGACDAVITVNASIATELEKRYRIGPVQVIRNAERKFDAPLKSSRLHEIFHLPLTAKIALLQGGLSAGRNLEVLIRAMRYVANPSVVLVVLGDGQISHSLRKIAKLERLSGRVFFHAAVPQDDLLNFTAAADVGVIPYQGTCLNNYYCTPNKLYEFIAAGIPVIGTDLPELRDIINGQQIGMVGDTSTPQKLGGLIEDFFSDERRVSFWKTKVTLVKDLICWEQEEQRLVDIYKALR